MMVRLHVSIELELRETGFCYKSDKGHCSIGMKWPGESNIYDKTPTSVLFDGDKPCVFGRLAEEDHHHMNQSLRINRKTMYVFKSFMKKLWESNIDSDSNSLQVSSECGRKVLDAQEVISGALKLIKLHILKVIGEQISNVQENDIEWIIPVSIVGSQRSKHITREAARKAGMNNLTLCWEHEAVAFAIMLDHDKSWITPQSSSYIVVQTRKDSVDIVGYSIDYREKSEITVATGGSWGSSNADQAFLNFFKELFQKCGILEFLESKDNSDCVDELLDEFQQWKYFRELDERAFKLPSCLRKSFFGKITSDCIAQCIDKWLKKYNLDSSSIQFSKNDGCLKIKADVIEILHQYPIRKTIDCLRKLVYKTRDTVKFQYLFLVGEFSHLLCFKERLIEFCKQQRLEMKLNWNIPDKMLIVQGALLYPHGISSIQKESTPKYIVGVDFGTRGTGFSILKVSNETIRNLSTLGESVVLSMNWNGESDPRRKTSTSILFNEHGPFLFGLEAEKRWEELVEEEEESGYYLFRCFKMQLNEVKNDTYNLMNSDLNCTSICGKKTLSAVDVISGSLKLIRKHVVHQIEQGFFDEDSEVCSEKIKWIVTVPAIWSEKGKLVMLMAAKMAGMLDVGIFLEPEAAAISLMSTFDEKDLAQDLKCIVLDAGGGTIDIVALQIGSTFIKDLICPSGGPWGSSSIDLEFLKMIHGIFHDFKLEEYLLKESNNRELEMMLLQEIENSKVARLDSTSKTVIRIPFQVMKYLDKYSDDELSQCIIRWTKSNDNDADDVKFSKFNSSIVISPCVVEKIYSSVIQSALQCLTEVLHQIRSADFLLLVGGFSRSPELRSALKAFCDNGKITFKIPTGIPPTLAVVHGAALLGSGKGLRREIEDERYFYFSEKNIKSSRFLQ